MGEAEASRSALADVAALRAQAFAKPNDQRAVERPAPDVGSVGRVGTGSWGEGLLLLVLAASEVAWLVTLGYLAHRFVLSPVLGY